MTLKKFKSKFKKERDIIERALDNIRAYSDELEHEYADLSDIINEYVDNGLMLLVENTDDTPSDVNLASCEEMIEELECFNDDEVID